MSEREKQHQFIKQLIRADTSDKCRELQARICKAERDERCIRAALFIVMVLALLSAAGVGYSAVLLPEFFDNSTPVVVKVFSALVLACIICVLGFCGFWLWYRSVCDRVYNECRNWIIAFQKPVPSSRNSYPGIVHKEGVQVYTIATEEAEHETQIITFPHASF